MNYLVTLNIGSDVIHPNSRASFLAAARRWGAQYLEIIQPVESRDGQRGAWEEKLHLDQHLPDGRFVYLDGDTVIRWDCPSPFEIVPPGTWAWTRNNIFSHRCTAGIVEGSFRRFTEALSARGIAAAKIDVDREYCNSGVMVFDLPEHRAVWQRARECVAALGFNGGDWVIADQGPLCAGVHLAGTPTMYLPSLLNLFGDDLWWGWTPSMRAFIYHFCGPINKGIGCGRTVWDETGPDRQIGGLKRWCAGKPVALHGGPEPQMLIREFSRVWRGIIVEVGVYLGGTTWYGATAARDSYSRYICVDHWRGASDLRVDDAACAAFDRNLRDAGLEEAVEIFRMASAEAAAKFDDESLDLVFIDGDHTREGCRSDIDAWWPRLKNGAVMLGHDYTNVHFPGVVAAVEECFGAPDEVGGGPYPIWKVTKRPGRHKLKG